MLAETRSRRASSSVAWNKGFGLGKGIGVGVGEMEEE